MDVREVLHIFRPLRLLLSLALSGSDRLALERPQRPEGAHHVVERAAPGHGVGLAH
jgi:hypothetical protein